MTTLGGFVARLQTLYFIPCTGCGYYVTRGVVREDAQRETWLLACGYCDTTVARATHLTAISREGRFDA